MPTKRISGDQPSSQHGPVTGAPISPMAAPPSNVRLRLAPIIAEIGEGGQTLSIRELFQKIKESHLRLYPPEDEKLAALYAAYGCMVLRHSFFQNIDDEDTGTLAQTVYYFLKEWKECLDEHKVVEIMKPGSKLNESDRKICQAIDWSYTGASYLTALVADVHRLRNSPPERTIEGVSPLTPASPGEGTSSVAVAIDSDHLRRETPSAPISPMAAPAPRIEQSRLTPIIAEWEILSIRERFQKIKESHLRLHPSKNEKLAALCAACGSMVLSAHFQNMDDEDTGTLMQTVYYTLKEWKECLDEHKVVETMPPASQLNDDYRNICQVIHLGYAGASHLTSFVADARGSNNLPPERHTDREGVSQFTLASPSEGTSSANEPLPRGNSLYPDEQANDTKEGKAKKKGKSKKKKKKTRQAPTANMTALPIASELREEDALPEGFEDTGLDDEIKEFYDGDPTITESHVIATCIPPLPLDELRDPDGHSIWFTKLASKRRYVANTAWPKPVAKFPVKLVVKETEDGTGMGVFATQDIKRFDPILVERPYLVVPADIGAFGTVSPASYKKLTPGQALQLQMKIAEQKFGATLDTLMTPELKEEFMSLANSHKHDGSGPILGVIRTNGFRVVFNQALPGVDQDFRYSYTAVGKIASRFNHSCIPDLINCGFDPVTFTLRFAAARDIKAGSQIYVNYLDLALPKAERQEKLLRYDFECTCRACVNATPESEKLRMSSVEMIKDWMKQAESDWLKKPNLRESVLRPLLNTKKQMEKDGLDIHETGYFNLLIVIHEVYEKVGNRVKGKEIKDLMERSNLRGWKLVSDWMAGR